MSAGRRCFGWSRKGRPHPPTDLHHGRGVIDDMQNPSRNNDHAPHRPKRDPIRRGCSTCRTNPANSRHRAPRAQRLITPAPPISCCRARKCSGSRYHSKEAYLWPSSPGSLFLFIRDLVDGDLIGWIDAQLAAADGPPGPHRLSRMAAALIEPMREIYGVSDKVLAMALSSLLLGAPKKMVCSIRSAASMIAIDTLVHNLLHRTGILARFNANHLYGAACYGLAAAPTLLQPSRADRRPAVQSGVSADLSAVRPVRGLAVLRQNGFDVCNGNRINDSQRCGNLACRVRPMCDRSALRRVAKG